MSPFRDAPPIELGPLDVGLAVAVEHAAARLPRGGRLVPLDDRRRPGAAGPLGSAGLVAVGTAALVAWSTGWQPASVAGVAGAAALVVLGGASLAAVFRAVDRTALALARPGAVVGREARAVLHRLARLEAHARRGRLDPACAPALRRALAAAADPDIASWIPADVRGRAELLLARILAATSGTSLRTRPTILREVRGLLHHAAEHLDDDAPARADLAEIAHAAPRRRREEWLRAGGW